MPEVAPMKSKGEIFANASVAVWPLRNLMKIMTFQNANGEVLLDEFRDHVVGFEFNAATKNSASSSTNTIVGHRILSRVEKARDETQHDGTIFSEDRS